MAWRVCPPMAAAAAAADRQARQAGLTRARLVFACCPVIAVSGRQPGSRKLVLTAAPGEWWFQLSVMVLTSSTTD